jgi:hypothetical protein
MKRPTPLALVAVLLLLGARAGAQQEPTKEVGFDYSLVHFTPVPAGGQARNLSGGGASFAYFVRNFGLKVDLQGYGSATYLVSIPAGNTAVPRGGVFNGYGNLFTYLGGPIIRKQGKWEPYAQVLLGGAHSDVYAHLFAASRGFGSTPANDAFALTVGVGLNVHLNSVITIFPVEAGYLLTHFDNNFTAAGKNQNNFRYVAGIGFSF